MKTENPALNEMTIPQLTANLRQINNKRYVRLLRYLADKYDEDLTRNPDFQGDAEDTLFALSELKYALDESDEYGSVFVNKYILSNNYIQDIPCSEESIKDALIKFTENYGSCSFSAPEDIYESIADGLAWDVAETLKDNDD